MAYCPIFFWCLSGVGDFAFSRILEPLPSSSRFGRPFRSFFFTTLPTLSCRGDVLRDSLPGSTGNLD